MRTLALLGAIGALLLSGCATYQMGTSAQLPYQNIAVGAPRNFSSLPQIEGPLNAALRQAIQSSKPLAIASANEADAILEVTLLDIRRSTAAANPQDLGRGRKFTLVLQLEYSLRKPGDSEEVYFYRGRPLTITRDIYSDSGQVDAEYQAIPAISQEIAARVTEKLVDLW